MSTDFGESILLSDQQQLAVNSTSDAVVVVASAGSGKTEVIARRVERLLHEDAAGHSRILAVSYTVKAADELRRRLNNRLGGLSDRVDAQTIHGFAHDLVRQHGTKIGLPLEPELLTRDEDRVELMRQWREEQGRPIDADALSILREVDLLRARVSADADVHDWNAALLNMQALDYPALLTAAYDLLSIRSVSRQIHRTYKHVIVDEAQNLTPAQYRLISAIIGEPPTPTINSTFVGDDKQSIVSFAGADPRLIAQYENDYAAERFALSINFRSATRLSSLAQSVAESLGHEGGQEVAHAAPGQIMIHEAQDETKEADFVCRWIVRLLENGVPSSALSELDARSIQSNEIAVLGRSATALRRLGPALEIAGVPYTIASASNDWLESLPGKITLELIALRGSADHHSVHWQLARLLGDETGAIKSFDELRLYLRKSEDPFVRMLEPMCDVLEIERFISALDKLDVPDLVGPDATAWKADLEQLESSWTSFSNSADRTSRSWSNFRLYCSRQQRGDEKADGVKLLTIHKSQGSEFKAVAIVGLNDGQLPDFRARSGDQEQAERRTFYVAITRPRRVLLLTRSRSRQTNYGPRAQQPSPYLDFANRIAGVERV
jgi:DNA helicase-2/ATP-dependent DNA helicase PcrA